MSTLTIKLDRFEMEKLRHNARENLRHPQEQARYILRSVLMNEPTQENSKPITNSVYEAGMVTGLGINP